jgi:chromate transporter
MESFETAKGTTDDHAVVGGPPHEALGQLFMRFLRFGSLAWGGPVAQIAMLRDELVEDERWISRERFNRTLAVYQVLPGPEATELAVFFGMIARGRIGGLLAGLGFVLPGFVLMFLLSWFYLSFGITTPTLQGIFLGFQAGVVALIVRAVHRIGGHALHDRWLFGIAAFVLIADLLGVHFGITLVLAGIGYVLVRRGWRLGAIALGLALLLGALTYASLRAQTIAGLAPDTPEAAIPGTASVSALLISGLRAGLLTFGGAYTVIPFLQNDAVVNGAWMTNAQFLDGIALAGILPAPLIIFSTFVGYFGGGALGALAMTFGIFFPAFAFTLLGHAYLERLVANVAIHSFLDGVTAGVVGLISATTLLLFWQGITTLQAGLIFVLALVTVYAWKARLAVAGIVLASGVLGWLLF